VPYRFADRVASVGVEPCGRLDAGGDLLLRRAPQLRPGTRLSTTSRNTWTA